MTYRNIGMWSHQVQEGSTNNMSNNSECKTQTSTLSTFQFPFQKIWWTAGVQLHVSKPNIRWNLIGRTAFVALHQDLDLSFNTSMEDPENMLAMPVHYEWRLFETIWRFLCHSQEPISPQTCPQQKLRFYSRSNLCPAVLCRLPIFQDLIPSKPPWLTYRVSLDFRKASALNALYLLEICKASSGSSVSRCFGGKCPSPSLGRQMFDLNKIHSMVSWWDASFWIHPDFICCSIASGGHSNHFLIFFCSLFWSSQCTMELRCIDWYMNLPTRATWLQERHCCKQCYIHEFIHKSSVSYDFVSLKPVTITSCLCKCFLFICDTLKSTCFCSDFKQIIYQDFRVIPARPGPSSIATRCQGSTSKVEVEIITETHHQSLEYHNKNRECVQQ